MSRLGGKGGVGGEEEEWTLTWAFSKRCPAQEPCQATSSSDWTLMLARRPFIWVSRAMRKRGRRKSLEGRWMPSERLSTRCTCPLPRLIKGPGLGLGADLLPAAQEGGQLGRECVDLLEDGLVLALGPRHPLRQEVKRGRWDEPCG